MDPLILSRWQFGITAAFHFIFPSFTIGLSLIIFIFFLLYYFKKENVYIEIGNFLLKIFAVGFAVGVATGLVMSFQFGTNWAILSSKAGGIFGGPLAIEAMFAFFLESTFLALLLFGQKRISDFVKVLSAFFVMIGTMISAFWILTVLNWMQIPVGYRIEGDKIVLTDFVSIIFNTPNFIRFFHTTLACFIAGSGLAMGISAYKFLKDIQKEKFSKLFKVSMIVFLISSIVQIPFGTLSGEYVAEHQPLKLAIMESKWDSSKFASEPIISLIDQENMTNVFEIGIPGLLSFLAYRDFEAEVMGIKDLINKYGLSKSELPSVPLVFWSFRGMVFLGFLFVVVGILSVVFYYTNKLFDYKWFLRLIIFLIPMPIIANWLGWIVTEVGRQPWVIYGILKTSKAVSNLGTSEVAFTLFSFVGIYLLLTVLFLVVTVKLVKKGIS